MQNLNQEVIAEGKKKVDVLQATKDFKKGIYGLQWEHTRGAMEVLNNTASLPPSLLQFNLCCAVMMTHLQSSVVILNCLPAMFRLYQNAAHICIDTRLYTLHT